MSTNISLFTAFIVILGEVAISSGAETNRFRLDFNYIFSVLIGFFRGLKANCGNISVSFLNAGLLDFIYFTGLTSENARFRCIWGCFHF
jgi:hypothetical protein